MVSVLTMLSRIETISLFANGVWAALGGIALFSLFLMARYGMRYFRARRFDALSFKIHKHCREIVRGEIPPEEWRDSPLKCEIVQSIVIQEIGAAVDKDRAGLQEFLRSNGLI